MFLSTTLQDQAGLSSQELGKLNDTYLGKLKFDVDWYTKLTAITIVICCFLNLHSAAEDDDDVCGGDGLWRPETFL